MRELRSKPLSEKHLISDVDFSRPVTDLKMDQRLQITIQKSGQLNGLRLSGESVFWDGSTLGATYAYSYPIILPLETRAVKTGDVFRVTLRYTLCGGMKTLRYAVKS